MLAIRSSGNASRLWVGQELSSGATNPWYCCFSGSHGQENDTSKYLHSFTTSGCTIGSDLTCTNDLTVNGSITDHYNKTDVDSLVEACLDTPYAGSVSSSGSIDFQKGYYTFTITKMGTGDYRINFGTSLITTNYLVIITPRSGATPTFVSYGARSINDFRIYTFNSSGTSADISFSFVLS